MTQFNTDVYNEQGGNKRNVDADGEIAINSGGELNVETGGVQNVKSGGVVTVASGGVVTLESGSILDVQSGAKVGAITGVTFVIGAEAADIINVGLQLTDAAGVDLAVIGNVFAFLSDSSTGDSIAATAPATSVAIGTDGAIVVEHTAKLAWTLQSETDGDIDIDITETGTDTWYLVVVLPDGTQVVSTAITFAA